jgi:hypothetical protein
MKKLVIAVLAVLVFVGSVWADGESIAKEHGSNLTRQQFDKYYKFDLLHITLYLIAYDGIFSPSIKYKDVAQNFDAIQRIYNKNTQMTEMEKELNRITNLCRNGNTPQCVDANQWLNEYRKGIAATKMDSEWSKYKNYEVSKKKQEEVAKAAKAEEDRQRAERRTAEEKMRQDKVFNNSVIEFANRYFEKLTPKKTEFESTQDFNNRLNTFYNDNTESYFKQFCFMIINKIVPTTKIFEVKLDRYDADKGIYSVIIGNYQGYDEYDYNGNENATIRLDGAGTDIHVKNKTEGSIAIPASEAQKLKENGFTIDFVSVGIDLSNYLCPIKTTIISKDDPAKNTI